MLMTSESHSKFQARMSGCCSMFPHGCLTGPSHLTSGSGIFHCTHTCTPSQPPSCSLSFPASLPIISDPSHRVSGPSCLAQKLSHHPYSSLFPILTSGLLAHKFCHFCFPNDPVTSLSLLPSSFLNPHGTPLDTYSSST